MTRLDPRKDCHDLAFAAGYPLDEPAEVALEDYVRALAHARDAEALRAENDTSMVSGVHVCGPRTSMTCSVLTDIEDFARSLVSRGGDGLGWS